ncbi:hypothetical protein TRVA0_007S03488 [Trichomonascus vanleenenianus]|uniref:SCA7 domain-containing protein n=1 Tax=Trichomonascus vanleenenianus TaxID=2268995 RepID=UPI003ECB33A2
MPKLVSQPASASASSTDVSTTPTKRGRKRKNPDGPPAPVGRPRKKALPGTPKPSSAGVKKEKKPKKPKAPPKPRDKGPVDVEKQCGVPLPNGALCARSLTCKTHSMGAKRAVPGRSQPYDVLLQAYQKRNQLKMAQLSTRQQQSLDNQLGENEKPLTEDEEFDQVMQGVIRSIPTPLERRVIIPTRLKTSFFREREMLISALNKIPPLPTPPANSTVTTGASIMAATGAVLGRTLVFDAATGGQMIRPPRVFHRQPQTQSPQQAPQAPPPPQPQ